MITANELIKKSLIDKANGLKINIEGVMIEFAKLHVKAALESALEDAPYGSSTDTVSYEDMKESILNAYPDELIK